MSAQADRNEQARQIYQDLLDRITASYRENDYQAFAEMVAFPNTVSSYGPVALIETEAERRNLFDDVRNHQARKASTQYHRGYLATRLRADDEIEGAYQTRLLSGNQNIERPYPSRAVMKFLGGRWMVCETDNALESDSGLGRVLCNIARSEMPKID